MKNIAVYTAIFGDYDDLQEPLHFEKLNGQADFFCFTDNPSLSSNFFTIHHVARPHSDPVKSNRYFKILSHKILSDYKYALYVDANVKIICDDLENIITNNLKDFSFAVFKHSTRNCLYEEAKWVLSKPNIDRSDVVENQIRGYREEGFPTNYGLLAGTFLLRRNNDPAVKNFNELWWNQVKNKSRRDQLSFDYIRWRTGIKIKYLNGSWEKNFIGIRYPHKESTVLKRKKSKNARQLVRSFIPSKLLQYYRYSRYPSVRSENTTEIEIERIKSIPNDQMFETSLFGNTIRANHRGSFMFLYRELFEQEIYDFGSAKINPLIIDCGTNIGMSLIYFKQKYPESKIIGFEPDDALYDISKYNIDSLSLTNIDLIKKGLWKEEGNITFFAEGADAGRIAKTEDHSNLREIQTVKLSSYLNQKVNFLKIDIEGAELTVLKECAHMLHNVESLFVEYHSFKNEKSDLSKLLSILENADFKYNISTPKVLNPKPYILDSDYLGMSFLLNIYAYRR